MVGTQCRNCACTPCACVVKPMEQGVDPVRACECCGREIQKEEECSSIRGRYCCKDHCCYSCGYPLLDASGGVGTGWGTWFGKNYCSSCLDKRSSMEPESAIKRDANKSRYDLIPPDALDSIAQVLAYGADKYSPRGWEKGTSWGRYFAACMRHLWAWWRGEMDDPESALPHLAHAACCVMFLLAYEIREFGEDDRKGGSA